MKVYCELPQPSCGLQRIRDALVKYAPPDVEIVGDEAQASIVIIYAIGRRDRIQRQTRRLLDLNKRYAIIQCCLRSTMSPKTFDWIPIWHKAAVVWSYYDLEQAFVDDVGDGNHRWGYWPITNFYHAPLGVDAEVFKPSRPYDEDEGMYIILSSGASRLSESVRECWMAARQIGLANAHLGPFNRKLDNTHFYSNRSDGDLARLYSSCCFVSGLRRTEGFELPAAEGLLCGTRPILFDTPDYRWNYKDWGLYINEGSRAEVVDQLVELFKAGAKPVTKTERDEAAAWFNWPRIIGGFYQRLR